MKSALYLVFATCLTISALPVENDTIITVKAENCQFSSSREICSIYGMIFATRRKCGLMKSEIFCRKVSSGTWKLDTNNDTLKIVSYNVRELPHLLSRGGERERTCRIPENINREFNDADVIVFQELFYKGCLRETANMARLLVPYGYRWSYQPLDDDVNFPKIIGAGLMIASKFPIMRNSSLSFTTSDMKTSDTLSRKGVIYAAIKKGQNIYHIFNTHLQATASSVAVRMQQVSEIKTFKDRQNIPAQEPVIFSGDFNEDYWNRSENVARIKEILDAEIANLTGPFRFTFDGDSAIVSGGGRKSWFDYIFISKSNKRPKKATMTAYNLRHPTHIRYCGFSLKLLSYVSPNSHLCFAEKSTRELSDHLPLHGILEF